jgi:hypothetical protein
MKALLVCLISSVAATHLMADSTFTVTLNNNGVVDGSPGQYVGWGFTVTNNDRSNYLQITGVSLGPGPNMSGGTGDTDNFTNSFLNDPTGYGFIAPGGEWTQSFSPGAAGSGLYEFLIAATATHASTTGSFDVAGAFYSDTNFDPPIITSLTPAQTDAYPGWTLNIDTAPAVTGVPEPASSVTVWLGIGTLLAIGGFRRKSSAAAERPR